MGWIRTTSKMGPGADGDLEAYPVLLDTRCLLYAVGLPPKYAPGTVLYLTTGTTICVEATVDQVHDMIGVDEKGY